MSVTIYEIAQRAGVSSSTVARILRGESKESHKRSADTARRIRQLATEMGYRPNVRARSLSRGNTHVVGLLYTDDKWIFEGMNTVIVNTLVRSFRLGGYHLMFCPIDEGGSWEEIVLGGQIDGGVTFETMPDAVRKAMGERQIPTVLLGDNSDPTVSRIVIDDVSGAYSATRHLIGLGHRRILYYVHESVKPHCSIEQRRIGYCAAMTESGFDVLESLHTPEEIATDMLLRGKDRPTGVVCYCNLEATLLVHAMWQHGVSIPRDVSVVGFNDVFSTQHMTPPLTAIAFDAPRIGELGAQLLLRDISATWEIRQPSQLLVKPRLMVRGSTGLAAGSRDSQNGYTGSISTEDRGVLWAGGTPAPNA